MPSSPRRVGNGQSSSPREHRAPSLALLIAVVLSVVAARAQDGKTVPSTPDHPYTLHVYTDLIQIPSLVLTPLHGSYNGLRAKDFTLRLDDGPPFHPVQTRLEGDDPLQVAILLDDSEYSNNVLLSGLDQTLAALPADPFRPHDHLTAFELDCNLIRSTVPAATVSDLRMAIQQGLNKPALHGNPQKSGRCHERVHLWDAVGAVVTQLHELPGRRVILVVTDGIDEGSHSPWGLIRQYANKYSVAIFGIYPVDSKGIGPTISRHSPDAILQSAGALENLSIGTGGLALFANTATVGAQINRVIDLLRKRYILEFPRAANSTAGIHQIDVKLSDRSAFVFTSGIGVPVQDKLLLNDPSTVPTDASRLPVMGKPQNPGKPN